MAKDKLTFKGKGYLMQLVLQSGGIKTFIILDVAVGIVCLFFTLFIHSFIPFYFFVVITLSILALLIKLALSPKGWAFFLESNYLYRVVKMQMDLIGDKQIGRAKIEDTKFVQPILEAPGDTITEAKVDHKKAIAESSIK